MKRNTYRKYWLLPVMALLILALSACGGLEKELRAKAEDYVKTLASKTGIQDTFTVSKTKPEMSGDVDPVAFTVSSSAYGKDFSVFVSRDGSRVTDSYYTLSFQDVVVREWSDMIEDALGKDYPETAVVLVPASGEKLSGRTFASLEEFNKASGNAMLLRFYVQGGEKSQLTADQIDSILIRMQEKGFMAVLYPYVSDSVWYDVTEKGVYITTRTGADGGRMLDRREYVPKADR